MSWLGLVGFVLSWLGLVGFVLAWLVLSCLGFAAQRAKADPKIHFASTDGSPAFTSNFKLLRVNHSHSAIHYRDVFSPFEDKFKKRELSPQLKKLAAKLSAKKASFKQFSHYFQMVGGDNKSESAISAVKGQMRRMLMLGRGYKKDDGEHVSTLAAACLLRKPGLESCLQALASYRDTVQLRTAPRDAFKFLPWKL